MLDSYMRCCNSDADSPETTTHYLAEEVDMQEWVEDRLLTNADKLGEHDSTSFTVIRANGCEASCWSDKDYEDMILNHKDRNIWIDPPRPTKRAKDPVMDSHTWEIQDEHDILPMLINEAEERARLEAKPKDHARVQITQYIDGKYAKGNSGNFEVRADYIDVHSALMILLDRYPKVKSTHRVRVQIQNKTEGKMVGGRNLSIPDAIVQQVLVEVQEILDEHGWLAPAPIPPVKVVKGIQQVGTGLPVNIGSQTEDGVGKLAESLVKTRPPTPNTLRDKKSQKARASLRQVKQELAALKAMLMEAQNV